MRYPDPAIGARIAKPWWHPSLLAGPLFSFAFFALGLLVLGWAPAILLLGFWLEEVLQLVAGGISAMSIARRRGEPGSIAGIAALLFFPLLHLIFIVVFLFIDSSGNPETDRLFETLEDLVKGDFAYALTDRESLSSILELLGFTIAAQIVEGVRRRRAAARDPERAELELETRLKQALVLPHLTIIAGGGVMILSGSGAWMAIGLIIAKALAELLLFPAMRRSVEKELTEKAAKRAAEVSRD
jgi:hypothetical protein